MDRLSQGGKRNKGNHICRLIFKSYNILKRIKHPCQVIVMQGKHKLNEKVQTKMIRANKGCIELQIFHRNNGAKFNHRDITHQ